ncbi:unnamed protein product [Lymnaea stagnalis]|uniref:VWFC domain-containing protein n=1 Tax=Lymnaea stagnalis TaxID=6523 RepID=A0AAV2H122_LYMST
MSRALVIINKQLLVYVSFTVAMSCFLLVGARPEHCTLGGHHYRVGETWHPELDSLGKNSHCVNCTCLPGGEAMCTKLDCPKPTCKEPKIPQGECCPSCEDVDNLPPTVGTDAPAKKGYTEQGCDFQGEHYEHGDVFPSNKTALRPQGDQCVLCECYNGEVICHLKKCIRTPRCAKLVEADDDCCQHCEDDIPVTKAGALDCNTSTGLRLNGTTWNPIIVSVGEIKCVECQCLNGKFDCRRLQCPVESKLPCNDPIPDQDGCCKECPVDKKRKRKKKGRGKRPCKNAVTSEDREDCQTQETKKNKKTKKKTNNKGEATTPTTVQNSSRIHDVIHQLCIPKTGDRLVYFTTGDNSLVLSIDNTNTSIEQHRWTTRKDRIQSTEKKVLTDKEIDDFRKLKKIADMLGAIDNSKLTFIR